MSRGHVALVVVDKLRLLEVEVLVGEHEQAVLLRGDVHALDVQALGAEPRVHVF